MFEHIHFYNHILNTNANDVKNHKNYNTFVNKYGESLASDSDYQLQGTSHYLMPRPLTNQVMQNLLYMQSFSYMEMGHSYFTERKNYSSLLIIFTYESEGLLSYGGKEYTLQEGDICIIDCRKYHYYKTKKNTWRHADLHIWGNYADFFFQENMLDRSPVFHCKDNLLFQQQLEKILRYQTSNIPNWAFYVSHEIENLLFLLLEWTIPVQDNQIPETLSMLRIYLDHHFQTELSLDDMARFSGISKYHLCRQFKKCFGYSPLEYILELRISRAKMLLQTSTIPSYKICTLIGFSNEANFIRHFKKATGMTPGQYRKQ